MCAGPSRRLKTATSRVWEEVSVPADMKVKASAVRFCSEGVNWPFSGFGERVVSKTEVGRPSPVGVHRRSLIRELQCYLG